MPSALRVHLRDRWRHLRLADIRPVPDPAANEELVRPKDNAEDHRGRLRAEDVDALDRGDWEWMAHGGSFVRLPERPLR